MTELEDLARRVVQTFAQRGLTLATSESLTGGSLGAAITAIPGASAVYRGGVIAYGTEQKATLSGVPLEILTKHGAVSEATAAAMAMGIKARTDADWAVATTGVAGPDGQEGHAPGLVWIAVVGPSASGQHVLVHAVRHHFSGDRVEIRTRTVAAALSALVEHLDQMRS